MASSIRRLAKSIVPKPLLVRTWAAYCRRRAAKAAAALAAAPDAPAWLGWEELAALQAACPLQPSTYNYDPESLAQRAQERVRELLGLLGEQSGRPMRFLDLGAWDGVMCRTLQAAGKTAVGVDIRIESLSPETRRSGAGFAQMDAALLGMADNSFDCVFSYNSFEHFGDPAAVLAEAWRVVRPGGHVYLNFGPLYYSPKGAHQFQTISVPYCECLFTKELLTAFAEANDITLVDFHWMNEWSLNRYRRLWETFADRLEPVVYYEIFNADHVELIERYPSCFKSKTSLIDDLIVSNIEALFRKR